jgi:hypothetical protein
MKNKIIYSVVVLATVCVSAFNVSLTHKVKEYLILLCPMEEHWQMEKMKEQVLELVIFKVLEECMKRKFLVTVGPIITRFIHVCQVHFISIQPIRIDVQNDISL